MKKRLTSPTFDASAQTVTHSSFSDVTLAGIQLIVNVTDQIIIYNFADTTKGGTLSTDTLTLEYDTTSMSDTDELMVLVEDGTTTQTVSGTVTAELSATDNAVLDTIAAKDFATQTTLAAINTKLASGTVIGDVNLGATDNAVLDAIEADTTTIAGDTTSIDGKLPALGQALAAASVPVVLPAAQITTLTPPAAITGFATSAKQDTIIGHVDGIETVLGTIDADTSTLSAGVVAGEYQVKLTDIGGVSTETTLATVQGDTSDIATNTGDLATSTGATTDAAATAGSEGSIQAKLRLLTSQLDAVKTAVEGTLTVTGGGGGTEYTEDVATANPIVGTATMIERDDVLSTVTPVEGDNIGLRGTAEGALWTQDFNSDAILADTTAIKTALETAGGLVVNLGANNDVTVTGSVTADLGVNNDVTVTSGTITANLSATDNAVLDTIDAVLDTINAKLVTGTDIGDVTINNASGASAVNIQDGGNTITVDGTVAVTGVATAANQTTIIGHVDGIEGLLTTMDADTGGILTAVQTLDNAISGSEMQVDVVAALPAGTNVIGDVGLSGARTSGGTTPYKNLDVDESEDEVKSSAGQVYWIQAINSTAAPLFLKFYNATAANVTVGTTTPVLTFPVPANADSDGAGFTLSIPNGIAFGTAITIAATTAVADNDTGAPGANALVVNLGYA